mgnify:CR=1 FL=1
MNRKVRLRKLDDNCHLPDIFFKLTSPKVLTSFMDIFTGKNNYNVLRKNFSLFLIKLTVQCNLQNNHTIFDQLSYRIKANGIFHYISILKTSKLMSSPI